MYGWGDEEQSHKQAWPQNPSPQGKPVVKQNGSCQKRSDFLVQILKHGTPVSRGDI
jgi:hypothetical protein